MLIASGPHLAESGLAHQRRHPFLSFRVGSPAAGACGGRPGRGRRRNRFRLADEESMRDRQYERLLDAVVGQRDHPASPLQILERLEIPAAFPLTLPTTWPTMPSTDFCPAVRSPLGSLSGVAATQDRSPGVSPAAFHAQSPDLRFPFLMNMDFAMQSLLVPRWRLISGFCSSTRAFAPRFFQTPPRDDALAFR